VQSAGCRVQSAVAAAGVPMPMACRAHAHAWTQVTRLSLERDMLEAEYARMALGSGRSAAERRRKVGPHTCTSRCARYSCCAACDPSARDPLWHETHCGMRPTVA